MRLVVLALAALGGCSQTPPGDNGSANAAAAALPAAVALPTPAVAAPTASATASADLSGRWIGVEGMYLVVAPAAAAGRYRLEMQWDLDHKGSFDGEASGAGIAFVRDGVRETLRPSDGDATGLKYLADKRDCLTVKAGEGYCRG